MREINYLFYLVLFIGFFLPSNSSFYIAIPGIQLQIREIAFILLPIINLVCHNPENKRVANTKIKFLIISFMVVILLTETIKHMYYGGGFGATFKTIRIGLPLFSSLLLLLVGIKADIKKVWFTLLWAVLISAILSLVSLIIELPIYSIEDGEDLLEVNQGRLMNANASFGIIGLYLLYRDETKWYNIGWLPKISAIASIVALILTFNRTYLALLTFSFIYLSFSELSFKKAIKYVSIPILTIVIFMLAYSNFSVIQRQVDKRIFDVVIGNTDIVESVYEDNREVIIEGVLEKINMGYWKFGLPISIPIFKWELYFNKNEMNITDTSFVNIFLRYGTVPLLIFIYILILLYLDGTSIYQYIFLFYLLSSINIDSLFRHNSILFLVTIYLLKNAKK